MADIRRIPFTEIVERVQKELIRDNSAAEGKYKSRVNDIYTIDLPDQIDWRHIRKEATITSTADYTTGTIALTNASTTVTGTGTTFTSANSNNLLLKAANYDEVYRVTYVGATSLTLDRNWVEDTDTSETYTLYQDRYALATDFSHMILDPDKSVYYWQNGNRNYLKYRSPEEFECRQVYIPNTPSHYTIKWVSGDPYIYIDPPDTDSRTFYYVYMPTLARMVEYTTGTITTLANGGTAVTGSGTDFDGFITDTTAYDYYFRIDGDGTGGASVWYKIASVTDDTSLTLSDAYGGTAISSGSEAYTICTISLLPAGLDAAIMYGAALIGATDQTNRTQIETWTALYNKATSQYRAIESKKNYGNQVVKPIYSRPGVRR